MSYPFSRSARLHRLFLALSLALICLTAGLQPVAAATGTYTNPLPIQIPGDGLVESCADPSVIQGQDDY